MRSTQRRGAAGTRRKLKTYWQRRLQVIGAAIEVHRTLSGPGLLESLYEEALYQELGLLLNFGQKMLRDGIERIVNDL